MFVTKIDEYRREKKKTEWYFSWSYGISWGAWLFLFGAAILLLIDKVRNKSVRKEKGFYDTNLWRGNNCRGNNAHAIIHKYQCLERRLIDCSVCLSYTFTAVFWNHVCHSVVLNQYSYHYETLKTIWSLLQSNTSVYFRILLWFVLANKNLFCFIWYWYLTHKIFIWFLFNTFQFWYVTVFAAYA